MAMPPAHVGAAQLCSPTMRRWACWVIVGACCSYGNLARGQESPEPPPTASEEYGAVATATRLPRPLRSVPATVTVLRREELDANPALTTDGVLRSVPSVMTFRRSTSLTADPSSQGLNLRGVGPSGVSRTLVLVDGVPANDPFAGSIYWRALPRLGLDRVEVVPGGGSALYGSAALAGVVQLISRSHAPSLEADALYGRFHTVQLAARGAYERESLGGALEAEYLRSDGYQVVSREDRGPIDHAADSWHGTLNGGLQWKASRKLSLRASLRAFQESQNGGTRYTTSAVRSGLATVGGTLALERGAELALNVFGRMQRFDQDRARVAMGRVSETLAGRQRVPAHDQGANVLYRSPTLAGHVISAGLDARRIGGESREQTQRAGGEQYLAGVFVQDLYTISDAVELDAALLGDIVRNVDGQRTAMDMRTDYPARTDYALSPRLGALWHILPMLTARASLYRAFRAATLNELYRPFQVGTILTAANPRLKNELLHGFEGGLELTPGGNVVLRATGFWNRLDDPITNVTIADGMRQRQNLGYARIRGLEASVEHRWAPSLTSLAAYTLSANEVKGSGRLDGKRLPQDPLHRASLVLLFDRPAWFGAALTVRVTGRQFEDDLNTLPMKPYAVVDLSASRRLAWNLELFAAVENLFDVRYLVGRAGVDTVGPPLIARGGVRLRQR
jgi:outer membrane receptor protein involved in Fe transport